jgi:peroxiredoxin
MINQQTLTQNQENVLAPDFSLPDMNGNPISLSDFRDQKHVVLVFNRGFM